MSPTEASASAFQPFVMERMMSRFEQTVEFNLSESGVHPLTLDELIGEDRDILGSLMSTELTYPQVEGTPSLRSNVSQMYEGAGPNNVLVTVGGIEANYLAVATLLSPGDQMVVMVPNYMQVWGLAKNRGVDVRTFALDRGRGWAPDLDELTDRVTAKTRMIAVCNPNNPTGRILTETEMDSIVSVADSVGAWILSDEVYRGAERTTDVETPSFFGRYDKVVAVGSMSKAYGMPGLRLGWAVVPEDLRDELWARHEYLTISATAISNTLGAFALSSEVRPRLVKRTRRFIREGFPNLERWMAQQGSVFDSVDHQASAVALLPYTVDVNSSELADRLRLEKSVLVVPGDHFGLDGFLRVSFGLPPEILLPALDRIGELLTELADQS